MFIEPPPKTDKLEELMLWCEKLHQKIIEDDLKGSAAWDPGSIAPSADEHKTVTVTGAELGDYAVASFSLDTDHLVLSAEVTASNTVECQLFNHSGAPINLGAGTVYVRVFRRTL